MYICHLSLFFPFCYLLFSHLIVLSFVYSYSFYYIVKNRFKPHTFINTSIFRNVIEKLNKDGEGMNIEYARIYYRLKQL